MNMSLVSDRNDIWSKSLQLLSTPAFPFGPRPLPRQYSHVLHDNPGKQSTHPSACYALFLFIYRFIDRYPDIRGERERAVTFMCHDFSQSTLSSPTFSRVHLICRPRRYWTSQTSLIHSHKTKRHQIDPDTTIIWRNITEDVGFQAEGWRYGLFLARFGHSAEPLFIGQSGLLLCVGGPVYLPTDLVSTRKNSISYRVHL